MMFDNLNLNDRRTVPSSFTTPPKRTGGVLTAFGSRGVKIVYGNGSAVITPTSHVTWIITYDDGWHYRPTSLNQILKELRSGAVRASDAIWNLRGYEDIEALKNALNEASGGSAG